MNATKLNVGSGPTWRHGGWATSDHKKSLFRRSCAWSLDYPDSSVDLLFSSHMLEHIPHFKIDSVLHEFNRVLRVGGGVRLLCPDLEVIARAYVEKDEALRAKLLAEDPAIRTDLGFGGSLANFVVSGGSDMLMFSRGGDCIGGYAHVFAYDFDMLKTLLEKHGFGNIKRCRFLESDYPDFHEPLHPVNAPAEWKNESQWQDRSAGMTGFDRDPISSLIVEAVKTENTTYRERRFGSQGYRGLDPSNFSWKNITVAYLGFTIAKARQLPLLSSGLVRAGLSWLMPPRSRRRYLAKELVNSSIVTWFYRDKT